MSGNPPGYSRGTRKSVVGNCASSVACGGLEVVFVVEWDSFDLEGSLGCYKASSRKWRRLERYIYMTWMPNIYMIWMPTRPSALFTLH